MKVQNINFNNPKPIAKTQFTGHLGVEKIGEQLFVHETSFFRDIKTNNLVKKYIIETFKDKPKIKIISAGCSTGEEAVTQSMMLDDLGKNVEILGIDPSLSAITKAKSRKYLMQQRTNNANNKMNYILEFRSSGFNDFYLAYDSDLKLSNQQQHCRNLFKDFFENEYEIPPKKKLSRFEKFKIWLAKKILGSEQSRTESRYYKLKKGKADNCEFVQGDVMDIDKILNGEKADVIFFRNTLYHLLCDEILQPLYENIPVKAPTVLPKLFQKFKTCLSDKGLIVFGEHEHLQFANYEIIPKTMKDFGFKPLNETKTKFATIWQKQ
jgi:chemotaxis methyl-accepting protein methylase